MDIGDTVIFQDREYELVARTEDGRPILDHVKYLNILAGDPFIVANEGLLSKYDC